MCWQLYCDNELIAEFQEEFTAHFCCTKLSEAIKDQSFEVKPRSKTIR